MEDSYPEVQELPTKGKLTVTAVVTRADGTVENLGVISEGWVGFETSVDPS